MKGLPGPDVSCKRQVGRDPAVVAHGGVRLCITPASIRAAWAMLRSGRALFGTGRTARTPTLPHLPGSVLAMGSRGWQFLESVHDARGWILLTHGLATVIFWRAHHLSTLLLGRIHAAPAVKERTAQSKSRPELPQAHPFLQRKNERCAFVRNLACCAVCIAIGQCDPMGCDCPTAAGFGRTVHGSGFYLYSVKDHPNIG